MCHHLSQGSEQTLLYSIQFLMEQIYVDPGFDEASWHSSKSVAIDAAVKSATGVPSRIRIGSFSLSLSLFQLNLPSIEASNECGPVARESRTTVKASNFGPHGNNGPFYQKGLLSSKRVLQNNEENKSCRNSRDP